MCFLSKRLLLTWGKLGFNMHTFGGVTLSSVTKCCCKWWGKPLNQATQLVVRILSTRSGADVISPARIIEKNLREEGRTTPSGPQLFCKRQFIRVVSCKSAWVSKSIVKLIAWECKQNNYVCCLLGKHFIPREEYIVSFYKEPLELSLSTRVILVSNLTINCLVMKTRKHRIVKYKTGKIPDLLRSLCENRNGTVACYLLRSSLMCCWTRCTRCIISDL